jgi:hypothetical protein
MDQIYIIQSCATIDLSTKASPLPVYLQGAKSIYRNQNTFPLAEERLQEASNVGQPIFVA